MHKERLIEKQGTDKEGSETWQMRISRVEFTDRNGAMVADLSPETQTLFTTWDLETVEDHADDHIWVRHLATEEGLQFGHTALVRLLDWHLPEDAKLCRTLGLCLSAPIGCDRALSDSQPAFPGKPIST